MSALHSLASSQHSSRSSSPAPQAEQNSASLLGQTHSAEASSRVSSSGNSPTLRGVPGRQGSPSLDSVVFHAPPPPPLEEDASPSASTNLSVKLDPKRLSTGEHSRAAVLQQALQPKAAATTTQIAEEAAPASVALPAVTKQEMEGALKTGLLAVAALANRPGFAQAFISNPQAAKAFLQSLSSARATDLDNMLIVFSALSQLPARSSLSSVVNESCLGILRSPAFTDTFRQGAVLLTSQDKIDQAQEKRGLCLSALIKCGFSVDVRDPDQVGIFVGLLRGVESRPALIQLQQMRLHAKAEGKALAVDSLAVEAARADAAAAQSAKHYILVKQELASLIGKKFPKEKQVPEIKAKLYGLCEKHDCSQIVNRAIDELTQKPGQPTVASAQKLFSSADAAQLKGMLR